MGQSRRFRQVRDESGLALNPDALRRRSEPTFRVKTGKAQAEHLLSGLLPKADITPGQIIPFYKRLLGERTKQGLRVAARGRVDWRRWRRASENRVVSESFARSGNV